jgi:large subunit ribosomal protein L13
MRTTFMQKSHEVDRQWFVIDATDKTLGRLATEAATLLRGKHKPTFTPHVDCGDYVIVINADQIQLTGNKLNQKMYYRYSGYQSGLSVKTAAQMREQQPERMLELAIRGMIPTGRLGRATGKKLFVYAGGEHPHAAQQPEVYELKG